MKPNTSIASALLVLASVAIPSYAAATSPLSEFQIQEILINPKGSSDETQGRELITLRGAASTSLDGYSLVVLENESSSSGNDGRGTVDNIIPLDGYVSDSNGYFVIRDTTDNQGSTLNYILGSLGGGDPFTGQNWPSRNGTASEMKIDFQSLYTISLPARGTMSAGTLSFGGNTLENEGGNYFLVKNINPTLIQQVNNAAGTKQHNGTVLDSRHTDKTLDYFDGVVGAIKPWDTTVDGVYVGAGSDVTNYTSSTDYVTTSPASRKAIFDPAAMSSVWTHTPDYVVRLSNSSGVALTHLDSNFNTIDDLFGAELTDSSQYFDQGTDQERLWDGTTISFAGLTIYAAPTYAFTVTVGSVTGYHP